MSGLDSDLENVERQPDVGSLPPRPDARQLDARIGDAGAVQGVHSIAPTGQSYEDLLCDNGVLARVDGYNELSDRFESPKPPLEIFQAVLIGGTAMTEKIDLGEEIYPTESKINGRTVKLTEVVAGQDVASVLLANGMSVFTVCDGTSCSQDKVMGREAARRGSRFVPLKMVSDVSTRPEKVPHDSSGIEWLEGRLAHNIRLAMDMIDRETPNGSTTIASAIMTTRLNDDGKEDRMLIVGGTGDSSVMLCFQDSQGNWHVDELNVAHDGFEADFHMASTMLTGVNSLPVTNKRVFNQQREVALEAAKDKNPMLAPRYGYISSYAGEGSGRKEVFVRRYNLTRTIARGARNVHVVVSSDNLGDKVPKGAVRRMFNYHEGKTLRISRAFTQYTRDADEDDSGFVICRVTPKVE